MLNHGLYITPAQGFEFGKFQQILLGLVQFFVSVRTQVKLESL